MTEPVISLRCSLCGGERFTSRKVLWPELAASWQLTQHEVSYVDEQQGCACDSCGASLRVVALGQALREVWATELTVREYLGTDAAARLRVLDINGAAAISPLLAMLKGYVRTDYPAVDLHALPYADGQFDLVVHSDTLEHVDNPVLALEQCRRTLAARGRLCFTVPVIVGRLSRSRAGLAKSHHGDPTTTGDDFLVHTEFGADVWTYVAQAGFSRCAFTFIRYPAAAAITAW